MGRLSLSGVSSAAFEISSLLSTEELSSKELSEELLRLVAEELLEVVSEELLSDDMYSEDLLEVVSEELSSDDVIIGFRMLPAKK
jgi:hypothetical protein